MKRRTLLGAVVPILAAGLLALPALAQSTLRLVPQADLKNIDPIWTTAAITRNHGYMIYDVLFAPDSKFTYKPQMVETHTVAPDGMKYSFTLRKGMTWHDGTPVTAKDAVQSIKRWAVKSGDGKVMMAHVGSLEAKDDLTFEMTLSKKFGLVIETLGNPVLPCFIMREADAKISADEQVKEPVGSGPFVFAKDEWVPGNKVVYKKNPKYVARTEPSDGYSGAKVAKVDRVEWLYIPDTAIATQALLKGEVDAYEIPPIDLLQMLKKDPNITVKVLDNFGSIGHLRFNMLHPPFNDARIRRAALLAIDQKAFLGAMIGNPEYERECFAVFVCGSKYETQVASEPYRKADPAKAKQLLAEAGYKGEPIVLMDPTDQQIIHHIAIVAAESLKKAGFTVDLQAMDWSTLTTRRTRKDAAGTGSLGWHIFPTWWTGIPMASPISNLPLAGDAGWFGWYSDPEIEKLRADFLAAADQKAQMEVIEKLQARYYDQVPYLNTGQFLKPVAWRNNLVGVPNATELVLWNIEKK
ncbi:MAG: ABC transporter substrate-binding protein [Alphaproteobacteria bacterium]|nr:ABC transporter substrate-binding protein [Alphaproteobacteria bacterium]